ncbi:MAG: hypothetical protein OEN50_04825, partial [Deltaproteobacteria bacterium]|nr:hypothetical protein [Deltaproteobacteria bacterium]
MPHLPNSPLVFNRSMFHTDYWLRVQQWELFRDVLIGGDYFAQKYVRQMPGEPDLDFNSRKLLTYNPGHAATAVYEVRDSIFQRMDAVRRSGGPANYGKSVAGMLGGVDLNMSTMNFFMGEKVLTELLFMGRVGIFVDSPDNEVLRELSLEETRDMHPYLYIYKAEDIVNWEWFLRDNELQLRYLRLRLRRDQGLYPTSNTGFGGAGDAFEAEFRDFFVDDSGQVFTVQMDKDLNPLSEPILTTADRIPFVWLEMAAPLLRDVARYQIALLNLESTDIGFLHSTNFNILARKYDPYSEFANQMRASTITDPLPPEPDDTTTSTDRVDDPTRKGANPTQLPIGSSDGLQVHKDVDYPQYLFPSDVPIRASMDKQENIKKDIKRLVNKAASAARSRFSVRGGATSNYTQGDESGLNTGLSAIGNIMETAERQAGRIWRNYEPGPHISVHYPRRYSLRTDDERRKDANDYIESSNLVPVHEFRKHMQQEAATIYLSGKVSDAELDTVLEKISQSEFPTADPKQLRDDVELGLVSRGGASEARGYADGEADKAEEERVVRDSAKMAAQGVPGNPANLS